jgi:hypothetical protein
LEKNGKDNDRAGGVGKGRDDDDAPVLLGLGLGNTNDSPRGVMESQRRDDGKRKQKNMTIEISTGCPIGALI